MKKQRGFMLLSLLLAMSILSVAMLVPLNIWKDNRERTAAKQYADKVFYLAQQLQLYHHHKVTVENVMTNHAWPDDLDKLMSDYSGAFWQQCSVADQQIGKCRRPESTPWNVPITYEVVRNALFEDDVVLTIPYGATGDMIKRWSAPLREQKKYPYTEMSNGDVKITVKYLTDTVVYKDFLKRDGSTTLTNDWDVGNKNILNVADITLRNADGTVMSVAAGLTRQHFSARHGTVIKSPSCPVRMNAKIKLATQGNIPNSIANDYENYGPMRIAAKPISGGWSIIAEFVATRKSDRVRGILREGVVAGETYCEPQ
ncbi:hypothetical protein [Photobacterium leiognathi]|uniref:hypothetical protein n=1 Tax=Photobacterium leiognathi TaxID=553611 RepID=UPI0027386A8D|nr:hypothetical protein [Photobacterium leiognathi]